MSKIIGYLVSRNRGPLGLVSHDKTAPGVLWLNAVTLFPDRRVAKKSIEATRAYMQKNGYDWDIHTFYISKVFKYEAKGVKP